MGLPAGDAFFPLVLCGLRQDPAWGLGRRLALRSRFGARASVLSFRSTPTMSSLGAPVGCARPSAQPRSAVRVLGTGFSGFPRRDVGAGLCRLQHLCRVTARSRRAAMWSHATHAPVVRVEVGPPTSFRCAGTRGTPWSSSAALENSVFCAGSGRPLSPGRVPRLARELARSCGDVSRETSPLQPEPDCSVPHVESQVLARRTFGLRPGPHFSVPTSRRHGVTVPPPPRR